MKNAIDIFHFKNVVSIFLKAFEYYSQFLVTSFHFFCPSSTLFCFTKSFYKAFYFPRCHFIPFSLFTYLNTFQLAHLNYTPCIEDENPTHSSQDRQSEMYLKSFQQYSLEKNDTLLWSFRQYLIPSLSFLQSLFEIGSRLKD